MGVQPYQRLSAEQWRELIEEQRRSGLSQRAFCQARGLTVSTFYAWRQRLQEACGNATVFGDGPRPAWLDGLAAHWPQLSWADDIRLVQWQKLVVNAALNPLTAIHDVPNGALLQRPGLRAEMSALIDEADAVLARLDPSWPADSHAAVAAVVRATAANTSSMRSDIHGGAVTEIEAINGWLARRAAALAMDLPMHRRILALVHALELRPRPWEEQSKLNQATSCRCTSSKS